MSNRVTHYQISTDLFLVQQQLAGEVPRKVAVELPTNHFAIIDCSGSMYGDLPRIREQLKRKLPKLLKEHDTMTLIWFSGRGQFGTLLKGEPVATLTDLQVVEQSIDRWLRPCCLTGFKEPLQEAAKVVEGVSQARPGSVNSLLFMSDGHDNSWSRAEILSAMEGAAQGFQSTTVVEYGYYADRNLLSAMAEKAGGAHIFAEDFESYSPAFEAVLQKRPTAAPRVEVEVPGDPVQGFVFALEDGDLVTYSVEGGKVRVPENLSSFWFVSPRAVGAPSLADLRNPDSRQEAVDVRAAYAAVSLYAVRMKSNVVYPLLKVLGDVSLIEEFSACFGKQRYSAFQERAKKAAFGEGLYVEGYDPNRVPPDDAFTVLELLQLLASDDRNRVLLDNHNFRYARIGRGRVDAGDQLSDAEQEEIKSLTEEIGRTKKASRIKEINQRIAEISEKPAPLVFKTEPTSWGYPISSLTFNEGRPNVSFLVRKPGTVDISARILEGLTVPPEIQTHVFRNYAVIKDGLVNVDLLPVRLTAEATKTLQSKLGERLSKVLREDSDGVGALHLRELPVINRRMVKEVSAKSFFELQYRLLAAQAEQKVYNAFQKELAPKERSQGLKDLYGEDAAAWLKEQGITDGGFAPKSVQAESTDFYLGKELKVSLKGYSKLPSLKEARASIAKGKVNGPTALMQPAINEVEEFIANAGDGTSAVEVWLDVQATTARSRVRELLFEIAKINFTIIVGQVWPREFPTLDEGSLTIEPEPGLKIDCRMEMREIEVRI